MKFFLILEIKSVSDQGEKCIEPNIMDFFLFTCSQQIQNYNLTR